MTSASRRVFNAISSSPKATWARASVSRGRVDAFSDDETQARRMGRLLAPPIEKNRRASFVSDGRFSSQRGRGFKNREAGGEWAPVSGRRCAPVAELGVGLEVEDLRFGREGGKGQSGCLERAKPVARLEVARLRRCVACGFSKFARASPVSRNPRRTATRTYLDGDVRQGSVDGFADATHAAGCDAAGHDGWVPKRRARVG